MLYRMPAPICAHRVLEDTTIVGWRDQILGALAAAQEAEPAAVAPRLAHLETLLGELFGELLDRGERTDIADVALCWERAIPSSMQQLMREHDARKAVRQAAEGGGEPCPAQPDSDATRAA